MIPYKKKLLSGDSPDYEGLVNLNIWSAFLDFFPICIIEVVGGYTLHL